MESFGIASVGAITVICYLVGCLVKLTKLERGFIPAIVGAVGAILGPVGMVVMPGFPAEDLLTAVAVGIVSGLASTGAHQLVKRAEELLSGD